MIKSIHLDYRRARTKEEKRSCGISNVETHTANVFINADLHRRGRNLVDTFFHEMVHVFLEFHGKAGQMSNSKEERLAKKVGRLCAEALK